MSADTKTGESQVAGESGFAPIQNKGSDDFASLVGGPDGQQAQTTSGEVQGGAVPTKRADATEGAQAAPAGEGQQTQQTQQTAAPAQGTQSTGIDPKVIEEIVAASARGAAAGTQQAAQRQVADAAKMTPEEFNQKYGIQTITEAHIAAILDQDPKKAAHALNTLLVGAIRSAVLMSQDVVDARLKATKAEYDPVVTSWRKFEAERVEQKAQENFYKLYPDLVEEKELVAEMTNAVKARVDAGAARFTNNEEAFKAVADASRKLLARMNKQASGGAQANASTQTQTNQRQMAALSTAGRQGTGQTATKSDVELVFGADAR